MFLLGEPDNEAIDILVVLLHITANDERAHAVTEEGERKTREALFDIIGDLVNVRNDAGGRVTAVVRVRDIIAVMALAVRDRSSRSRLSRQRWRRARDGRG